MNANPLPLMTGTGSTNKSTRSQLMAGAAYVYDFSNKTEIKSPEKSVPSMGGPKAVENIAETGKPQISAMNEKLESILQAVTDIRKLSQERQNDLIKQEADAIREDRENAIEGRRLNLTSAEEIDQGTKGVFDDFAESLSSLINKLDGMGSNRGGILGMLGGIGAALPFGAAKNAPKSMGKQSGKLANAFKTIPKVGLPKVTKDSIKKLAAPLIQKSMGKTIFRSIPILGAVAGGAFAVGRLMDGDVVGAGLDLTSGIGGPLTAIPAFITSVSRDIYFDAYGIQPEKDPQAPERLKQITEYVKEIAGEMLMDESKKVNKPTLTQTSTKMPPRPPTQSSGGSSSSMPSSSSRSSGAIPGLTGSVTASAKPAIAATSASSSGTPAAPPPATPTQPKDPTSVPLDNTKKVNNLETKNPVNTGNNILKKSETIDNKMNSPQPPPTVSSVNRITSPQRFPTTRSGYTGTGNVPDPTYYNTDAYKQLYFSSYSEAL